MNLLSKWIKEWKETWIHTGEGVLILVVQVQLGHISETIINSIVNQNI